jgi:serine/threonine protein kinase
VHGDLKGVSNTFDRLDVGAYCITTHDQPNILVDSGNCARITDFGSSFIEGCGCKAGQPGSYETTFTSQYMSFELWETDGGAPATVMSDIWAFGCVALEVSNYPLELLSACLPFRLVVGSTWYQTLCRREKLYTTSKADIDRRVPCYC